MQLLQQIDAPIAYLSFFFVFKVIDSIDKLADFAQILFEDQLFYQRIQVDIVNFPFIFIFNSMNFFISFNFFYVFVRLTNLKLFF